GGEAHDRFLALQRHDIMRKFLPYGWGLAQALHSIKDVHCTEGGSASHKLASVHLNHLAGDKARKAWTCKKKSSARTICRRAAPSHRDLLHPASDKCRIGNLLVQG